MADLYLQAYLVKDLIRSRAALVSQDDENDLTFTVQNGSGCAARRLEAPFAAVGEKIKARDLVCWYNTRDLPFWQRRVTGSWIQQFGSGSRKMLQVSMSTFMHVSTLV